MYSKYGGSAMLPEKSTVKTPYVPTDWSFADNYKIFWVGMPKSKYQVVQKNSATKKSPSGIIWLCLFDICYCWGMSLKQIVRWESPGIMAIRVVEFSRGGIQNQKGFWLKINCNQMKILNFENWSGGELAKIGHHFRK